MSYQCCGTSIVFVLTLVTEAVFSKKKKYKKNIRLILNVIIHYCITVSEHILQYALTIYFIVLFH